MNRRIPDPLGDILAFALGCGLSSVYGFLADAWPFGVVEAIWSVIALRRYLGRCGEGTRASSEKTSGVQRVQVVLLSSAIAMAAAAVPGVSRADDPIRTIPDPMCAPAYAGTSGVIGMPADPGLGTAAEGGEPAPPEVVAALPATIAFRDNRATFNGEFRFALHGGRIYAQPQTGAGVWRTVGLPACLDGNVGGISADGDTLLAIDRDRWIYTVSLGAMSPQGTGWTRRWGPFFWTDLGMQIPADVTEWAASDISAGQDGTYTDRAGNEQEPFGALTVYLLRGDGQRITYLDPWLPSDESREVCAPDRGTIQIAGLSASGSTVAMVSTAGQVFSRLYDFDISGANTVFYDYAWEDQRGVAAPLDQLPAPDWVEQPRVPGRVTDRVSLEKIFTMPTGRLIRVEGLDADGHTGHWEKDVRADAWSFVRTDAPLRGTLLPRLGSPPSEPEDLLYEGVVGDLRYPAEIADFNPYCSPATLRVYAFGGETFDLIVHSVDGLRQERRARGLDDLARGYRSAIEVPLALWERREMLRPDLRDFFERWFGASRFLDGPLTATESTIVIGVPCWTFHRPGAPDRAIPAAPPDLGAIFAGVMAAQEEAREPSACTTPHGAP